MARSRVSPATEGMARRRRVRRRGAGAGSWLELGRGDPGQAARPPLPPRARREAPQAYRLGEQAAGDGIEPIVTTATGRPPLTHFLDERRAPYAGVRVQDAGREQWVERVQDPL